MAGDEGAACFICEKHQHGAAAQGGVLFEDDVVYVGHVHALDGPTAYRGYLMIEPKRHVHRLGDLTDDEAAAIGRTTNRMARLLRDVLDAEHVYSFVYGDAVEHLHVHLAPRYAGTPTEFWGHRLTRWPHAPQVDSEARMRELVSMLRESL